MTDIGNDRLMDSSRDNKTAGRLRVLFVPQSYPTNDGTIRSGEACREHVRAAALYDEVAVLAFTSRRRRWPTMHWRQVDDDGVPTFYASHGLSPIPKTSMFVFQLHLQRALRRVIQEWGCPDVIHTEDRYGYFVIKAAQGLRTPVVISQHWSGFIERSLDQAAVKRFAWAFARAARVFPANKFAVRDYQEYALEPPMTWMPNALDTEVFQPPLRSSREPWILHASGFTREKCFPDIVRAFARVRRAKPAAVLQVAGDGINRAEMESLAARELPPASFQFHGWLSKPELAELMKRASGFVLPSQVETFGCVLMEAIACECPVLTTRVGGIPAVVHEGDGLFVDVGRIDQIAEGMGRLLDGTHGLNMTRISREIRQQFSRETVGRLLHEEYLRAAHITDDENRSPSAFSCSMRRQA